MYSLACTAPAKEASCLHIMQRTSRKDAGTCLWRAGLTLKLAFFPDAVSDSTESTSAAQQSKDDNHL